MLKNTTLALVGCGAWLALSGSAHAEHFDFDPGMGPNIESPNLAASGGKPYDWYYQGINLDFVGGVPADGREDASYQNTGYGNIPYIIFDGTDKSSAGHCLQIVFARPNAVSWYQSPSHLRFSFVDKSGVDRLILDSYLEGSNPYSTVRMWVENTGTGLYWQTKIADLNGLNGSWNHSATMNIWRLDKNKTDCISAAVGTGAESITMIGTTGNYQVCEKSYGCFQGG